MKDLFNLDDNLNMERKEQKDEEYKKAIFLVFREKYKEASELLDKYLDNNPENFDAYILKLQADSENYKVFDKEEVHLDIRILMRVFKNKPITDSDAINFIKTYLKKFPNPIKIITEEELKEKSIEEFYKREVLEFIAENKEAFKELDEYNEKIFDGRVYRRTTSLAAELPFDLYIEIDRTGIILFYKALEQKYEGYTHYDDLINKARGMGCPAAKGYWGRNLYKMTANEHLQKLAVNEMIYARDHGDELSRKFLERIGIK